MTAPKHSQVRSKNGDGSVTAPSQAIDATEGNHVTADETSGAPDRKRERNRSVVLPRLVDLETAGAYIGISRNSMRSLILAGVVPVVKIPCPVPNRPRAGDDVELRRILIDLRDLDALVERSKERFQ